MVEKQSTAKGFTILGAAGIINKVLAVLYVPILTLLIGDTGNGIYNAGYNIYLLVFVITNMGIPVAISKLVSEQVALGSYEDSHRTLKISALMMVIIGLVMTMLTAVFANWLSHQVGRPEAYLTILALSPTMFFTAVSSTFRGYFQGRSNMTPTGMSQVIEQLINSVFTILFAWMMLQYGLQYAASQGIVDEEMVHITSLKFAAAGGTVGTSVGALGSALYLVIVYLRNRRSILQEIREEKKRKRGSKEEYRIPGREIALQIVRYALPITLGSAAVYTANLIDLKFTNERLMVAGFSSLEAASLYGILTTQYQKIINIPLSLASALSAAIIPGISAAAAKGDRELLGKRINNSFRAIFMITVPAAVGLAVLARPIIAFLFPRNIHGDDLMMMGSGVLILIAVVNIQTAILQGMGKTHIPTLHMIGALVVKIVVNYILIGIPAINVKGAVFGSLACYSLACGLNAVRIRRFTQASIHYKRVFNRPLMSSLLMGAAVLLIYQILSRLLALLVPSYLIVNGVSVILSVILGGFMYFLLMYRFRGITYEDLNRLPGFGRIKGLAAKIPMGRWFLRYIDTPVPYHEIDDD